MILFSHTLTPRLQYVANFLSQYYQIPFHIICDEEKYIGEKDPHRINYSFHRLDNKEIWIHSHVLLFETAVRPVKVECYDHTPYTTGKSSYKAFFKTEGDTGFDLFAGLFYLITRYEEYLPHQKDSYGRYAHESSVAFKEGFLHLPLVNIWLQDFASLLKEKFPGLKVSSPAFNFLPTYDIDMAWMYKNKGFKRNAGALAKLLFTGQWKTMTSRISVLRGKKPDPYDAYEWMDQLHKEFDLHPLYFFLVAQQPGKLDRNIDVNNQEFRALVQDLAKKYKAALHPSWASGDHPTYLPKEKAILEQIIEQPVHASRQHFIRFDLPVSYRRLVALGINEDYSMGYGSINGFRASIASTYYWYDIKNELVTPLLIYPFCYMDATSFYEHHMSAEDAYNEMLSYYNIVKEYNGLMITIWHNSFLGIDGQFEGWREVYRKFVAYVTGSNGS